MSMENDVNYLKSIPVFQRLDDAHLQFVVSCSSTVSYGPNEVVFNKGEAAEAFYLVVQGTVGLYEPQLSGNNVLVQIIQPREILGWSWMVPPYEWQFTAECIEPAILMKFDAGKIRARCEQEPAFGFGVMRRICEQMMTRLHSVRSSMAHQVSGLEVELARLRAEESEG